MTHVLVCHGTATKNQPYLSFPNGGLFDTLYDAIRTTHKEILDGPELMGNDKNFIIALGVFIVLEAIQEGEQSSALLGHSRGAIIATLIAHELCRIKKKMATGADLYHAVTEIFTEDYQVFYTHTQQDKSKEQKNSKSEIALYCKELGGCYQRIGKNIQDISTNFTAKQLEKHQVHLFLVDPVPGGRFFRLNKRWNLPMMYEICENVRTCKIFYMQHERTRAFKAVYPRVSNQETTAVETYLLYGNHGNAIGRPYSQQDLPPLSWETSSLIPPMKLSMEITFFHAVNFLLQLEVELDFSAIDNRVIYEDRGPIKQLLLNYTSTRAQGEELLLGKYEAMFANKKYFQELTTIGYPFLGTENLHGERIVHYHGHENNSALSSIIELAPVDERFVNNQHYDLFGQLLYETLASNATIKAQDSRQVIFPTWKSLRHADVLSASKQLTTLMKAYLSALVDTGNACLLSVKQTGEMKNLTLSFERVLVYFQVATKRLVALFFLEENTSSNKKQAVIILQEYLLALTEIVEKTNMKAHIFASARSLCASLQQLINQQIRTVVDYYLTDFSRLQCDITNDNFTNIEAIVQVYQRRMSSRIAQLQILQPLEQAITGFNNSFLTHAIAILNLQKEELKDKAAATKILFSLQSNHLQLSYNEKKFKVKLIWMALDEYSLWMRKNTLGPCLFNLSFLRYSHIFHGRKGRERAAKLQEKIDKNNLLAKDCKEEDLDDFLVAVEKVLPQSGNRKHSLSRYIYKYLYIAEERNYQQVHSMTDRAFRRKRKRMSV